MSHSDLWYVGSCDSEDACFGYPRGPLRYMQHRIATGYYCEMCVEVITDGCSQTAHATQKDRSRSKRESVATERTKAPQTAQELRGKLLDALSVRMLKPKSMPRRPGLTSDTSDMHIASRCDSEDACCGNPMGPLSETKGRFGTGYFCKDCVEVLRSLFTEVDQERSKLKRESLATEGTKAEGGHSGQEQKLQELRGKLAVAFTLKPKASPKRPGAVVPATARPQSPPPRVPTSPVTKRSGAVVAATARPESPPPLVPTSPGRGDEADSAAEATSPTQEPGDEPGITVTREEAVSAALAGTTSPGAVCAAVLKPKGMPRRPDTVRGDEADPASEATCLQEPGDMSDSDLATVLGDTIPEETMTYESQLCEDVRAWLVALLQEAVFANCKYIAGDVAARARTAIQAQRWPIGVLEQLSTLADHWFFNKEGESKDAYTMVERMRAAHRYRKQLIEVRLMTDGSPEQLAQAHQEELTHDEVVVCFKKWASQILENELTDEQRWDDRYHPRYDGDGALRLSRFQRSFINSMLRKRIGNKEMAMAIWQIGLPASLDSVPTTSPLMEDLSRHDRMLQSGAEDIAQWLGRLGAALQRHSESPTYQEQRRLVGDTYRCSGRTANDLERKRQRAELVSQRNMARRLCEKRDRGYVRFHDLDPDAQRLIEDCDTQVFNKRIKALTLSKHARFRV